MNLTTIAAAIAFATGLAVGSSGAWQLQTGRVASIKLELQNEKLDRANERIAIQRAARATLERNMQAVSKAQAESQVRSAALMVDRDRAISQLDGLRDASAASMRAAGANLDACTATLATHGQLLTQCAARYIDVAADADSWASGLILFQDAWPK